MYVFKYVSIIQYVGLRRLLLSLVCSECVAIRSSDSQQRIQCARSTALASSLSPARPLHAARRLRSDEAESLAVK